MVKVDVRIGLKVHIIPEDIDGYITKIIDYNGFYEVKGLDLQIYHCNNSELEFMETPFSDTGFLRTKLVFPEIKKDSDTRLKKLPYGGMRGFLNAKHNK